MIVAAALGVLILGGTIFYLLIVVATGRVRNRESARAPHPRPSISFLKPLSGLDLGLERNLTSFFQVDYPDFEILFGVHTLDDPAAGVAERLIERYPQVRARRLVIGEPDLRTSPNRKVHTLTGLAEQAAGELLVVSDSDIFVSPDCLDRIAADFSDPKAGVLTCPYRGVGGGSLWSELEAIGMNTEFWGGVFVAQMLGPMDFAVGPTMAVRRACLDELGGFEAYRGYLAEDFVIGRDAREKGWNVALSSHVVQHRIGSQPFARNLRHRLRWYRSTRRSRPAGYLAQVFTYPLVFALGLLLWSGGAASAWGLAAVCACARVASAWAMARFLGQRTGPRFWLLLPFQDALSFLVWLGAFFGNRIVWRDYEFHLTKDGRLRPCATAGDPEGIASRMWSISRYGSFPEISSRPRMFESV